MLDKTTDYEILKRCLNCGHINSYHSKTCGYCGLLMMKKGNKICPKCGFPMWKTDDTQVWVCGNCNNVLEAKE